MASHSNAGTMNTGPSLELEEDTDYGNDLSPPNTATKCAVAEETQQSSLKLRNILDIWKYHTGDQNNESSTGGPK